MQLLPAKKARRMPRKLTSVAAMFCVEKLLLFLKIHPFNDGNGRTSRLLEKWFLAQKLGEQAWYIQSEKHYYKNLNDYYKNLQRLGFEYETLDYDRCLPFLLMLPASLSA